MNSLDTTLKVDASLLQPLVPFKDLLASHLDQLIAESEIKLLFPGDILLEQGQYDEFHYYLLSGQLRAVDRLGTTLHDFTDAALFPIADRQPRPFRLIAREQSIVFKVSRERLDQLLTWSQASEYMMVELAANRDRDEDAAWLETILRSNLFLKVPPTNVGQIIDALKTRLVNTGDVIVRQGEIGDCCYFIKQGDAEVTRHESATQPSRHLADITVGRCFGEDALLRDTVRNATVTMRSDGTLLQLNKLDFLRLLRAPEIPAVGWREFNALRDDCVLIDVRTESEYAVGHLPFSVNLPLSLLRLKERLLDTITPLLVYCDTARRSATAAWFLQQRGFTATVLGGGMSALEREILDAQLTTADFLLQDGQVVAGH